MHCPSLKLGPPDGGDTNDCPSHGGEPNSTPDSGEPNGGYAQNCGMMKRQSLKNPPYGFFLFDTDCEELNYPVCQVLYGE